MVSVLVLSNDLEGLDFLWRLMEMLLEGPHSLLWGGEQSVLILASFWGQVSEAFLL